MLKVILRTTFFYYGLALIVVFNCINFEVLHDMRRVYLLRYLNSSKPQYGIVLYDYLTHLNPQADAFWMRLAENDALGGDCRDAIRAYRRSVSINPREESNPKVPSLCGPSERKNPVPFLSWPANHGK